MIFAVCIVCPMVIIFTTWSTGYAARYCVDFAWQIVIGALIISFIIYNRCSDPVKNLLNKIMVVSAFICFIFTFAQTYNWINPTWVYTDQAAAEAMSFERLFEFWR